MSTDDQVHFRSFRPVVLIVALALTAATLFVLPQSASAEQRCPEVTVSGTPMTVGVGGGVSCDAARSAVLEFYDWYLDQPGSAQSRFLEDFFCRVIAGGHLECNQEPGWIYASSMAGAKPWTWPSPWYLPPPKRALSPPFLSPRMAKRWMRVALGRHFGGNWDYRVNAELRCGERVSRNRVKCRRVAWAVGDLVFWGRGAIWYRRVGEEIEWNYSFKIRALDQYCVFVYERPRSKCLKKYVVR